MLGLGIIIKIKIMNKISKLIENPYIKILSFFLAVIITFFAWFFPIEPKKELKINLEPYIRPIEISENIERDDLSIIYKEDRVNSLSYLNFNIKNTGKIPIRKEDFAKELKLEFPQQVKILSYKTTPSDIIFVNKNSNNILSIYSDLINPKDFVSIEILCDDNNIDLNLENIRLSGRIAGIEEIKLENSEDLILLSKKESKDKAFKNLNDIFVIILTVIVLIPILVFFMNFLLEDSPKNKLLKYIQFVLRALFLSLLVISIIWIIFEVFKFIYLTFYYLLS